MKKAILFLVTILFTNLGFSQFLTTGTVSTDNKYRSGGIGIGYTTLPTFGTNKFMVNGNSTISGNLGLGTTAPLSKLHLPTGNIRVDAGAITIGNQFTTFGDSWYGLKSSRSIIIDGTNDLNEYQGGFEVAYNYNRIIMGVSKCNNCYSSNAVIGDAVIRAMTPGSLIITNDHTGDIKFETNESFSPSNPKVQMRIDKFGNIGIGTGNSSLAANEKLAVNGLIHTKEVKVDLLGWPDYVFAKEYKLPTLEEVEKQIKEKGHLANIPSVTEVENNGVLLGEMNKKLLEKVEELTLYIIQMNKEIELLKKEIKN